MPLVTEPNLSGLRAVYYRFTAKSFRKREWCENMYDWKKRGRKMLSYSVFLPSYSVGEDCYQQIPYVTRKYGKTAVVIGGKTAMEKARQELDAAVQGSDVQILDYIWYGGNVPDILSYARQFFCHLSYPSNHLCSRLDNR